MAVKTSLPDVTAVASGGRGGRGCRMLTRTALAVTEPRGTHDCHIAAGPARSSASADLSREDAPGQPGAPVRPGRGRARAGGEPRHRLSLAGALRRRGDREPARAAPRQAPAEGGDPAG